MEDTVGKAWFELGARDDQLDRDLKDAEQKVKQSGEAGAQSFEKSYTGAQGRVVSGFGKVSTALAAVGLAIGISTALTFFDGAIKAASDLNETISKTGVILGQEALPELEAWAEGMATAFGQSKQEALDAASTFAIFGKSAGLAGDELADFSTDLAELGGDLSSFFGGTPEEAIQAIGAALRGESEPIRRYGVLLDEATLRQRALTLGIIETTTQALTPQQRVLAAQAEIFAQTADAQGDYARTSGDLAQQGKTLRANLENLNAEIGEKLLPVMVKLATFANDELVPALQALTTAIDPIAGILGALFGTDAPQSWEEIAQIAIETGRRIPIDTATALREGGGQVEDAAAGVFGAIPEEEEEARIQAVAIARMIPRDVAKAMIAGQRDVESGVALLTQLMNDEWTDAARLQYYNGVLASEQLAAGMASEDADVRSAAIDVTNNALREVGRLESGFYDAGARQGQNVGSGLASSTPTVEEESRALAQRAMAVMEGVDGTAAGEALAREFADGLASPTSTQYAARRALALSGAVSGYLMGASPPKLGPLREIDKGGYNVGRAWAEGFGRGADPSRVLAMLGGSTALMGAAVGAGASPAPGVAAGSASRTNQFILQYEGQQRVFGSPFEAIDELHRLGAFSEADL